jgi:hypothetical protein
VIGCEPGATLLAVSVIDGHRGEGRPACG